MPFKYIANKDNGLSISVNISSSPIGHSFNKFVRTNAELISTFSIEESIYPDQDFIRELNEAINNPYQAIKSVKGFTLVIPPSFLAFISTNDLYQDKLRQFLFWDEQDVDPRIALGSFRLKDLNISEEDKAKLIEEWQQELERFKPKILECLSTINSTDENAKQIIEDLKKKEEQIKQSKEGEANNTLYNAVIDSLRKNRNVLNLSASCIEALDCYETILSRKPLLITPPTELPSAAEEKKLGEEEPRNNACKEWEDYWGVKFTYKSLNIDGTGKADCHSKDLIGIDKVYYSHEWILTLLPAMRSVLSKSGSVDVPNAMPGLQFVVKSNIAKHKIPGFQPLYQHMGVDSILVTMVGAFTGDGGLSKIVENKNVSTQANYSSVPDNPYIDETPLGIPGSDFGEDTEFNIKENILLEPSYEPWDLRENSINPISHPITEATNNRVLRNVYNSPYRFDGTKPTIETHESFSNAIMYGYTTSQEARKGGMFMRDGCPWSCEDEDYYSGEGRQPSNQGNADVTNTHTLLELAAYNDSYHEFTSFYRVAIEQGHEMEIEINMRQNRDHLNPQQNRFLKYGKDSTGRFGSDSDWGPLRNGENGNPKFKGVIKALEAYHARSDRTWYVMQIEITDYGLIGAEPINLTNNLEEETKRALESTRAFVANQQQDEAFLNNEEREECAKILVENATSREGLDKGNADRRIIYFYKGYGVIKDEYLIDRYERAGEVSYFSETRVKSYQYELITDPIQIVEILIQTYNWESGEVWNYLKTFNDYLGKELPDEDWTPDNDNFIQLNGEKLLYHRPSKTLVGKRNSNVKSLRSIASLGGDKTISAVNLLFSDGAITQDPIEDICNRSSTNSAETNTDPARATPSPTPSSSNS